MWCLTGLGLVLNLFTHMWISKNPVETENLQNVGIIIQDPSMIFFTSTDFPRTINGNAPGEENNGGALRRNNGEKAFLVVKRAGAVSLPSSWYIRDAATKSLKNRIMMNEALHSNLFHGCFPRDCQRHPSCGVKILALSLWFKPKIVLQWCSFPGQFCHGWNCRFVVGFAATDHNRPWTAAKPVFREVK